MIENAGVPRSRFSGSWTRKTTFDAGLLVPILVDEVLPGDHLSYDVTAYVRMATPLFPLFDNQRIDSFFFFVPNRLVWDNWAKFMGEQEEPGDSVAYTIPQLVSPPGGFPAHSLADHFGLPGEGQFSPGYTIYVNALPFRAYNLIFNHWFRDQQLVSPRPVPKGDGPDNPADYQLMRRAKAHDYFTSALPWPQRHVSPSLPLGGLAPVVGIGTINDTGSVGPFGAYETGGSTSYAHYHQNLVMEMSTNIGATPQVYADLSEASGVAIETFRQAFLVQSLLERDARGGSRYVEMIRAHFGVTSPDFRLSRPEYIGGGQSSLQLTPVAQTAPTPGAPVGALGAAGTSVGSHRASYAATEHGYIIGLINVRTELSYGQGVHRMWSRRTRFDFYWPALAGLGEQAILRQELWAVGEDNYDEAVFGYQERWHEYRARYSEVTGLMRSQVPGTLDAWHLAERFETVPWLNQTFIEDNPPMVRVLAAGELAEHQQYLADILFQRNAVRPIPLFGTPVSLGRF
nr:MAG: major capsid protein [Microvirus sp.]